MQQTRFPPGALGLAAISAIDHCLWDISAKALGRARLHAARRQCARPGEGLCRRLHRARSRRGARRVRPRSTSNGASPPSSSAPTGSTCTATAGARWCARRPNISAQLRETVRADYEIAFDAHAKIFEPAQAIQLGNALAPYDPLFFEEPIRPENFEAWGELKRGLDCTLATGESLYSRFEFLRLLQVRGADIIQPDICVVGGLLEMRKIAALAEAHYVTVAPHNPMGPLATAVNVHFCAAQPNFRILEYRLPHGPGYVFGTGAGEQPRRPAPAGRWYVKDPYLPKDGYLELRPDRPGWGVEMDEELLGTEDYVHWERKVPVKPDGSSAYV